MNIDEIEFKRLVTSSIAQDQESCNHFLDTKEFIQANYYQGKVDALNSVLYYFKDEWLSMKEEVILVYIKSGLYDNNMFWPVEVY